MKPTIKVKIYDKHPYFVRCECGNTYKNQFHKWYKKHIKQCKAHKNRNKAMDIGTQNIDVGFTIA